MAWTEFTAADAPSAEFASAVMRMSGLSDSALTRYGGTLPFAMRGVTEAAILPATALASVAVSVERRS
ncbi:MAG TPA: hypothetical protein VFE65_34675 [Pseudonocardia sp.]|nr:hypothetical protein [Pseudonocardia sp.]